MGINLQQFIDQHLDAEKQAAVKAALDADAIEAEKVLRSKDDAIASLQTQINALTAQVEELKELEGANYDLKKQLDVKTAENAILRESVETLKARIAELKGQPQPEPAPESEPEEPTPPTGLLWPKSATTGPRPGVVPTPYTGPMIITKAGTVISGKIINGTLEIKADDVTIEDSLVKATSLYGIFQDRNGGKRAKVRYCEIDGTGSSKMVGIALQADALIEGNDIHGMVLGVTVWGNDSVVRGNYIHDLAEKSTKPDDRHFDGIGFRAGRNLLIDRNAIIMPEKDGGTAATFITSQGGAVSNVRVTNNLMTGDASYTAYAAAENGNPMTAVVYDSNYIEKGIYGCILNSSGAQYTNNVEWDDTTQEAPEAVKAWRAAI